MDDFLTMQHNPPFRRFSMFLIDADTREFITGFYISGGPVPQSGDMIQVDDDVYEVDKRLFEIKTEAGKKAKEVRFSLLVRHINNN